MSSRVSVAIERLTLTDFRNYSLLVLEPSAPLVALVGDNGAGKTNILEAISLLTAGRGLRRAALADIARLDGPGGWAISALLRTQAGETVIGTGYTPGEAGRRVRIDGTEARSSEALLDHLRVLWLVPSMDGLFTGPGSERRRFLDRLTLSLDPTHGRRVNDYERALRQRNRLLEEGGSAAYLDSIERQVAELGAAVALARGETVSLLQGCIDAQAATGLPFPRALLAVDGEFEVETQGLGASDREDRLRRMLRDGRTRDRAAGRTLCGPHRSDLVVQHAAKGIPAAQSSTGEQKALLVGLILAHADLTAAVAGMTPVLLLDEIAAHLDPGRRAALFSRLEALACQVVMTGTDAGLFEAMPAGSEILAVAGNRATRLS
ncbi:DNA replication/repair protein RecF [Polymorphum gilvum]|uniref:DNA replication and repair protein RecF n=1 Tax=Polymorphum gilvum (strain LMG 25793 / CGMCC 1.9160 / SL003B-26A1) TaxID=991905 RepID=F2IXP4_POLGS|nr:DNA replication/repair protein RecF [Polymorphum gilvum]ADZ68442.1 DNA replication and repair protein recF [Polymorphum gilvum SL003B-26A1]